MNLIPLHWAAALVVALGIVVPPVPTPVDNVQVPLPATTSEAWVLYDAVAGEVIAGSNEMVERPMASVTKIVTALVVRDTLALDERIRISASAAGTGEAEIGLVPGERWSVRDLLYAVLVRSGNDAAVALAEAAGGSVAGFAEMMNAKATSLGLSHSHFVNPHGLDDDDHYTTAFDLAVLADALLDDPELAEMVRTKVVVFKPAPDGSSRISVNTNQLLGVYPDLIGVKTGFTGKAGRVLVSTIEQPGERYIAVVMGAEDQWSDSRELLEYGRRQHSYSDLVARIGSAQEPLVLSTGRESVTAISTTAIGAEIEAALRSRLPAVLGGTGG